MYTEEFTLERDDRGPLRFEGIKIADVSSQRPTADRWTELRVYRVIRNGVTQERWVVESVGQSRLEDDRVFHTVKVCDTPAQVVEALKRNGRLVGLGMDAAEEAADRDVDDILDAYMFEEERL